YRLSNILPQANTVKHPPQSQTKHLHLRVCIQVLIQSPVPPLALLSFPTRRSSDLSKERAKPEGFAHSCSLRADPAGRHAGYSYGDRKSTRLNSSHVKISSAVFCLQKNTPLPLMLCAALFPCRLPRRLAVSITPSPT